MMKIKEMNPFCILKVRSEMLDCHPLDCIIKKNIASKTSLKKNTKLSKNNNIIIQKADKGNTVILLDKSSYIKKMEELLADTSKFAKVEFNKKHKVNQELRHVLDLEGNIKICLNKPLEKQYISKEDYNFLKP